MTPAAASARARSSRVLTCTARCRGCTKVIDGPNARGSAARHHDATGHTIDVELHEVVTFGDDHHPDQLAIDA